MCQQVKEGKRISFEELYGKLHKLKDRDFIIGFESDSLNLNPIEHPMLQIITYENGRVYIETEGVDTFDFSISDIKYIYEGEGTNNNEIWIDFIDGNRLIIKVKDLPTCCRCSKSLRKHDAVYTIHKLCDYTTKRDGTQIDLSVCEKCFEEMYRGIID